MTRLLVVSLKLLPFMFVVVVAILSVSLALADCLGSLELSQPVAEFLGASAGGSLENVTVEGDYVKYDYIWDNPGDYVDIRLPIWGEFTGITINTDYYGQGRWDGFHYQWPYNIRFGIVDNDGNYSLVSNFPAVGYAQVWYSSSSYNLSDVDGIKDVFIRVAKNGGLQSGFDDWYVRFKNISVSSSGCLLDEDPSLQNQVSCPLVPNFNFDDSSEWELYYGAAITNSTLILGDLGAAGQNISGGLSSNTTYNVAISVTQIISSPEALIVSLGSPYESLPIVSTGLYTTSFTTDDVVGPLALGLQGYGPGQIVIDYVCLSLASTSDDGQAQYDCIAPTNGDFTSATAGGWEYFRGAVWQTPAQRVMLPQADNGLLSSFASYTMPTLAAGKYLLFGFDAKSTTSDNGQTTVQLTGAATNTNSFETFQVDYRFEIDISSLAEQTISSIAVVNPGSAAAHDGDVSVDNLCIFVADRGPNLPAPTDEDVFTPIDLGGPNVSSCADVDAIWAGFGVNMAQHRAVYAAGISIWDPIEWLSSAIWVTMADWSCLFMSAYSAFIDTLEYIVNNIVNIYNSTNRSSKAFATWLGQGALWFFNSGQNIINDGLAYLNSFPALRVVGNWLVDGWNSLVFDTGQLLSGWIEKLSSIWNDSIFPVLQWLYSFTPGATIGAIFDLIGTAFAFLFALGAWLITFAADFVGAPIALVEGFSAGMDSSAAFSNPFACVDDGLWCFIFVGFQIINQTVSDAIMYPLVIVCIIIATIVLFQQYIDDLGEFILHKLGGL